MRLTIRQNLNVFGMLYGVRESGRPDRGARRNPRSDRSARPADRQALRRTKDAGLARQVADQFAGAFAARRADRLARSRHRRLGARAARALLPRPARHRAPCLAQHGRGRTAVRARHHHEARPHRGRRHAGRGCSPATAGAPWKKCFSTSPAAATKRARRRNDRILRRCARRKRVRVLAAARRGDDAALLVSVAFVVAAADRADLLAHGADDHLGLHPILRDAECQLFRPRRRHADRRGAAVGHSVPRPARLLDLVSRGDVGAQHRQSDDDRRCGRSSSSPR